MWSNPNLQGKKEPRWCSGAAKARKVKGQGSNPGSSQIFALCCKIFSQYVIAKIKISSFNVVAFQLEWNWAKWNSENLNSKCIEHSSILIFLQLVLLNFTLLNPPFLAMNFSVFGSLQGMGWKWNLEGWNSAKRSIFNFTIFNLILCLFWVPVDYRMYTIKLFDKKYL